MAVREVILDEPEVDENAGAEAVQAYIDAAVQHAVARSQAPRVEHVRLFPAKATAVVLSVMGNVVGSRLLLLLAAGASFYLTMTRIDLPAMICFNLFIVLPAAALAYVSQRQKPPL